MWLTRLREKACLLGHQDALGNWFTDCLKCICLVILGSASKASALQILLLMRCVSVSIL